MSIGSTLFIEVDFTDHSHHTFIINISHVPHIIHYMKWAGVQKRKEKKKGDCWEDYQMYKYTVPENHQESYLLPNLQSFIRE